MNIVETLLKYDAGQLEMPKGQVTIFCKKIKQELTFDIQAIDPEKLSSIQTKAFTIKKGDVQEVDMYALKTLTILEGCSLFKNKELLKHFKASTPKEFIKKLLLSGEIDKLYEAICNLNECIDDIDAIEDEVKN